jgi:hypothetical protein
MPETDKDWEPYFPKIANKKNKEGTSIVFQIQTDHLIKVWKQLLLTNKIVKDLNLYMGEHKLRSTEIVVIGFLTVKHPDMTHMS